MSHTIKAIVAIDSPSTYPDWAVKSLAEFADRPSRSFDSLDTAIASFRLLPDDSQAAPAVLRHIAIHSFRPDGDGKWSHKMDRRTLRRDPIDAWPTLADIQCPALFVRPDAGAIKSEQAEKIVARMPRGHLVTVPNSGHHVPLDNPGGLIRELREFLAGLE
jgi:pimeloyl-ACP methyl ester carboxylesterase